MRIGLVSRYPRVDTPAWKRDLATRLLDQGADLFVLYSRSSLPAHGLAAMRELEGQRLRSYLTLRRETGDGNAVTLSAWAQERGVEVLRHPRLHAEATIAAVRRLAPDVLVLVGADIVPATLLDVPRAGTINAHYGLLPRYRGMNVTEWSIYQDDPVGVSVHWVDAGIDTGPLIAREPIQAMPGDSLVRLRTKHRQAASQLLASACEQIQSPSPPRAFQDRLAGSQYYRMHPILLQRVERKLDEGSYRWMGASSEELCEEVERWAGSAG